ncbi:hypothetical protein L7F22_036485 [Adiantum nelumboides]|nr:hypothetical protein [Adiantum nelumboides]
MVEEGKLKIEKFNGKNYQHWKMQIKDYLYNKDLYMPLEGYETKPLTMTDEAWKVLDLKALGTIRLCMASAMAGNIVEQKTTKELMTTLDALYEKPSASNKVFLMKRLFNLKMAEHVSVAEAKTNIFLNEILHVERARNYSMAKCQIKKFWIHKLSTLLHMKKTYKCSKDHQICMVRSFL